MLITFKIIFTASMTMKAELIHQLESFCQELVIQTCRRKKARANQAEVYTEQGQNSKSSQRIWAQNKKKFTGNTYYIILFPSIKRKQHDTKQTTQIKLNYASVWTTTVTSNSAVPIMDIAIKHKMHNNEFVLVLERLGTVAWFKPVQLYLLKS